MGKIKYLKGSNTISNDRITINENFEHIHTEVDALKSTLINNQPQLLSDNIENQSEVGGTSVTAALESLKIIPLVVGSTGPTGATGISPQGATGISPQGTQGATGPQGVTGGYNDIVLSNNFLIVDATNGNNSTAIKGSLVKKYSTIAGAESIATSGDTILVTTMMTNEVGLGKDEITYHFLPGTGITNAYIANQPVIFTFRNGNVVRNTRMFHDIGKTNNGENPIKFYITGEGDFVSRGTPTDQSGFMLITEGSIVEFIINSSTLLESTGSNKADIGAHFYFTSVLAPENYPSFAKGSVTGNVMGGHYFLSAHASNAVINVGGNVDISANFVQAEGTQLIDLTVGGKITCGYCVNNAFKYVCVVDRVPWFTGNVDTIAGTNTFRITAKMLEWQNSGMTQVSYFDIFNFQSYDDSTGIHKYNYIDINIDEIHIKAGDNANTPTVFEIEGNNSLTYTRIKFDKCKIVVDDGFELFNINSANEKAYLDLMFQDCSIDYKHDSLGANAVIIDIRYIMLHFINTRFKVSDQGVTDGYIILDDSSNTDKNVQIDNITTNGVIPTTLLNYNTLISTNSDGILSGVSDIRII